MRASATIIDGIAAGPCFVCGESVRVGSVWQGAAGPLWLCAGCAEIESQPLAAILADAIAENPRDACRRLERALERLHAAAWRALALAMERRG